MTMKRGTKLPGLQAGIAGEYVVAAELSRLGYAASITLRNTKGIDILASNVNATRSVGIQVTMSQGERSDWMLNQKAEDDQAENLFYVFVCLPKRGQPLCHVVLRRQVARFVRKDHRSWLNTQGNGGRPLQDNPVRRFRDPELTYRDRWDLLGLDP